MKTTLLLGSLLGITGCNFSNVDWTKGTWAVAELTRESSSDECDVLSVFESIEPLTYEFGTNPDTADYHYVNDSGNSGMPLEESISEEKRTAGLANLWDYCSGPDYSTDIYCRKAMELLHSDKWLPQVKELISEKHCESGEVVLQYSRSEGGLLSKTEALINSKYEFYCLELNNKQACDLRLTSRLRPVD